MSQPIIKKSMRLFTFCFLYVLIISSFSQNLPKSSWKVVTVDSEENNEPVAGSGPATCIIDNNINTFWTTGFETQRTPFPHYVVIDLGGVVELSGFVFYPRQKRYLGRISDYKIFIEQDNHDWKLIHEARFPWKDIHDYSPQHITLKHKSKARYIKFEVERPSTKEENCVHMAELDVHGVYTSPYLLPRIHIPNPIIYKNESVQFIDSSFVQSTKIRTWKWNFPGGIPSKSSECNPMVRYPAYGKYCANLTITSIDGIKKSVRIQNAVTYLPAPELSRLNWKLSVSDEELLMKTPASAMIDNNTKTYWHTTWYYGIRPPHFVIIDLGQETSIHAIGYLPRQTGSVNGIFRSYKIYVSNDSIHFSTEVCSINEPKPYRAFRYVEFPVTKGRYVKIIINEAFPKGTNFASASEIYVYGEVSEQFEYLWIVLGIILLFMIVLLLRFITKRNLLSHRLTTLHEELITDKKTRVHLFGKIQIIDEGVEEVHLFNKIKQIFVIITYYTIDYLGISTTDLSRLLWFDLPEENVASARSSNVRKLRTALESVPVIQIVVNKQFWNLQITEQVYVDFKSYRELYVLLSDATNVNQYSEVGLKSFLSIIQRGRFIEDLETEWADHFRTRISEEIINLLRSILVSFNTQLSRKIKTSICDCLFLQDKFNADALRVKIMLFIEDSNLTLAMSYYETFAREYKLVHKESFPISFTSIIQS